jgi:hypothetical protein
MLLNIIIKSETITEFLDPVDRNNDNKVYRIEIRSEDLSLIHLAWNRVQLQVPLKQDKKIVLFHPRSFEDPSQARTLFHGVN